MLHGTRTEADNRKATPRHVVHDTGGTYFTTRFWTNYIDRVSPRTHDSRIGRTRALATCVMADPRALYGMCSQRQTRAPLVTLCYRAERGMNGHILLSVHGFAITSYHRSSLTTTATNIARGRQTSSRTSASMQLLPGRGVLRSPDRSGRVMHHGAAIDQRESEAPGQACGTDATLGRSSGHSPGVLARQFIMRSSVWAIRIMSCGRSETFLRLGVTLPEVQFCCFRPSRPGWGWGQSERLIQVMTRRFGVPPGPAPRGI